MFEEYPDILTVSEATAALRIDSANIQSLLDDGFIKHIELGGNTLLPKLFLQEFLENRFQVCYSGAAEASGYTPPCQMLKPPPQ